jgi:hypothetical protein
LTPAAGRSVRLTVPRPYPLSDSIPGGGHFLLERTDDTTVPDVSADQTYSGGLGNDGEDLFLRGATTNLIDHVDCISGWFAGRTEARVLMGMCS